MPSSAPAQLGQGWVSLILSWYRVPPTTLETFLFYHITLLYTSYNIKSYGIFNKFFRKWKCLFSRKLHRWLVVCFINFSFFWFKNRFWSLKNAPERVPPKIHKGFLIMPPRKKVMALLYSKLLIFFPSTYFVSLNFLPKSPLNKHI